MINLNIKEPLKEVSILDLKYLDSKRAASFLQRADLRIRDESMISALPPGRTLPLSNPYSSRINPEDLYEVLMDLSRSNPKTFKYRDVYKGDQVFRLFRNTGLTIEHARKFGAIQTNFNMFQLVDFGDKPVIRVRGLPEIFPVYNNPFIAVTGAITRENDYINRYDCTVKQDGMTLYGWSSGRDSIHLTGKDIFNPEEEAAALELLNTKNSNDISYLKRLTFESFTPIFEYVSPKMDTLVKHEKEDIFLLALVNRTSGDIIPATNNGLGSSLSSLWKRERSLTEVKSREFDNQEGEVWYLDNQVIAQIPSKWYARQVGDI